MKKIILSLILISLIGCDKKSTDFSSASCDSKPTGTLKCNCYMREIESDYGQPDRSDRIASGDGTLRVRYYYDRLRKVYIFEFNSQKCSVYSLGY